MSEPDERWLFDVLVALADHAHERGMNDVSARIEEALDALIAHEGGAAVVPFRSARGAENAGPGTDSDDPSHRLPVMLTPRIRPTLKG